MTWHWRCARAHSQNCITTRVEILTYTMALVKCASLPHSLHLFFFSLSFSLSLPFPVTYSQLFLCLSLSLFFSGCLHPIPSLLFPECMSAHIRTHVCCKMDVQHPSLISSSDTLFGRGGHTRGKFVVVKIRVEVSPFRRSSHLKARCSVAYHITSRGLHASL